MTVFERFENYKKNNPCRTCTNKNFCLYDCKEKVNYNKEISLKEKVEATRRLYSVLD